MSFNLFFSLSFFLSFHALLHSPPFIPSVFFLSSFLFFQFSSCSFFFFPFLVFFYPFLTLYSFHSSLPLSFLLFFSFFQYYFTLIFLFPPFFLFFALLLPFPFFCPFIPSYSFPSFTLILSFLPLCLSVLLFPILSPFPYFLCIFMTLFSLVKVKSTNTPPYRVIHEIIPFGPKLYYRDISVFLVFEYIIIVHRCFFNLKDLNCLLF